MSARVMEAEEEIISSAGLLVVVLHQRKQSRGSRGTNSFLESVWVNLRVKLVLPKPFTHEFHLIFASLGSALNHQDF